ncbi:hypothetical protein GRF29_1536g1297842 [Pseudopithomyces chartarum]|uniref:Uncharacterized protein n=1 Tax=Pseudopithomyces chartarum TaxID=1892770 RepID=A0AAN6LL47_9PLEO|nr:hypothetical protein GRF29_1536g1297842 [Pseudopithomyces chartarum]
MNNARCALRSGRLFLHVRPRPLLPRRLLAPVAVRFAHSPKQTTKEPTGAKEATARMQEMFKDIHKSNEMMTEEQLSAPLTEDQINDPNAIPISIYEEDPNSPTGERLVQEIRTPDDRRKHNEMYKMLVAADKDPNYAEDNPELNRHLIDGLLKDPYFADLTDELMDIKENYILTKQQRENKLAEAKAADEAAEQAMEGELKSTMQLANHEVLQDLINDPDFSYAKEELAELQDILPEIAEGNEAEFDAEFETALNKVKQKLEQDPNFEKKMAALQAEHGALEGENTDGAPPAEGAPGQEPADVSQLLGLMKQLMGSMGYDEKIGKLEAELEQMKNEDIDEDNLEEEELRAKEMSFIELGKELLQLSKSGPEAGVKNFGKDDTEDNEPVDPALEAKVDAIMQDPKLMEKLMYIRKIIDEEQQKQAPMPLAPDPTTLDSHRIASIKQRMQIAKSDPEHRAALQVLRVDLPPPFNIAPALRVFNEAIEYAYIGANDDIRRILWRAYIKARSLPTFLQNLSDDAWDILYYSQAVTWGSNQNREAHLRVLLQDLQSVGKSGPPTHPDTIAEMQRG